MMKQSILLEAGIRCDLTLERIGHKEALLERMLRKILMNQTFAKAQQAMDEQNREQLSFQIHALRGLSLNLDLVPLLQTADILDATLRTKLTSDALFEAGIPQVKEEFQRMAVAYQQVYAAVAQALED